MKSMADDRMQNKTQPYHRITTCLRSLALIATLLAAHGAMAQDEGQIWQGLFNYQQKMANIGNAEAQYKLAEMYAQGQGVQVDPAQARRWYEASAAQGYEPAQRKLAALAAGQSLVKTSVPAPAPVAPPPVAAPAPVQQPAPPAVSQQELARMEHERKQLEQELARSRETMRRMQEEQARKDAALKKAEAEKDEARRRLAAKELLEAEMKKLRETPATFD
jgi:hypothetical protein